MRHTTARLRRIGDQIASHVAHNVRQHRQNPDAGYTTETIVVTALLILLGIAALGILTTKVIDKANGFSF